MNRWRRIYLSAIVSCALFAPAARLTQVAHAENFAGSWGTLSYYECAPNSQNTSNCNGNYQRIVNPFFAQADSAGNFTHNASIMVQSAAANTGPRCDPGIFSQPFTGTCLVSDFGSGFIQQGSTGLPDFWVADETATFGTTPPVTIHAPFAPYPVDIGTPAVTGSYSTQQILGLSSAPPPGVTALTVVERNSGAQPPAVAMPLPATSYARGISNSFLVAFLSTQPGQGKILFGSGPGCSGLVEVATNDLFPGARAHTVQVIGNDLPGTVGDVGILSGTTYWYETVTVTVSGVQVDDNGGKCYSVTMP